MEVRHMPTYEYECTSCGNRFERRQSIKDEPLTDCPSCDGKVRRVLFPVGIVFKGSGFYVTDNRKAGLTGNGEKSSGSEIAEKKSETKTETPVETKSDSTKESVGAATDK